MRVGRYRWTITQDFQIHLYSPRSANMRLGAEALEDANKVIRDLNQPNGQTGACRYYRHSRTKRHVSRSPRKNKEKTPRRRSPS